MSASSCREREDRLPLQAAALGFVLALFARSGAEAHDPGISRARLLELGRGDYVLEVDASPMSVTALAPPILPERFVLDERPDQLDRGGYVLVSYRFRTRGEPLRADDVLLLPWDRNGAYVTAQWMDGSVHQALFMTELFGIRVPLSQLTSVDASVSGVLLGQVTQGALHALEGIGHWLLVVSMVLIAGGLKRWGLLLAFTLGQAFAPIALDLGARGIGLATADALLPLAALLLALEALGARTRPWRSLPLLGLVGLLHGLGIGDRLWEGASIARGDPLAELVTFGFGIDLTQWSIWMTALAVLSVWGRGGEGWSRRILPGLAYTTVASAAVLLILGLRAGELAGSKPPGSTLVESAVAARLAERTSGMGRSRPARAAPESIAAFVTIDPIEIRLEVLLKLSSLRDAIGVDTDESGRIPVASHPILLARSVELVTSGANLSVDGQSAAPVATRADFATVEPSGVTIQIPANPPVLAEAVVAVSLAYSILELPEQLRLEWRLFPPGVHEIPSVVTDPFGWTGRALTPSDARLEWTRRIRGYRGAEIRAVVVQDRRVPVVSMGLAVASAALALLAWRRRRLRWPRRIAATLLCGALFLYPFLRSPVEASRLGEWGPTVADSARILDSLLTNVYRAFEVRDEGVVYDRLAVSVTGDQLTEVYLENRRALELEERGGARARVDSVEIREVRSVRPDREGRSVLDASWTVGGSVTHFGHTHYRRNRYDARVWIAPVDGVWKISRIEVIREERFL